MNSLFIIFMKELRELFRDRKTLFGVIVVPLVMYPLLGAAINISQTSAEQAVAKSTIAVTDLDSSPASRNLTAFLVANARVDLMQSPNINNTIGILNAQNYSALLVIPQGYGQNISQGLPARLKVYALFYDLSITESGRSMITSSLLVVYRNALVVNNIQTLLGSSGNATYVLNPIQISIASAFRGKVINVDPSQLLSASFSQSLFLPLVVMLMLIFAMQLAATSLALEKEEKTLETLLTLPMSRLTILTGKLAGSVALAGMSSIAYMVGFSYYINSVTGISDLSTISQKDLQILGLAPSPTAYVLMGIIIFVTVISALALAISLAVFADNVRSAQSLLGILVLPIIMPMLVLTFADINILPSYLQFILYALPYTHTLLAIKAIFLGDVAVVVRSMIYISLFTMAVLYIAARIFTSEKVVTGRLFSRRRRIRK